MEQTLILKTLNGKTPLYWASQYGELAVVKILADRGADIAQRNQTTALPRYTSLPKRDISTLFSIFIRKVLISKNRNAMAIHLSMLQWGTIISTLLQYLIENASGRSKRR